MKRCKCFCRNLNTAVQRRECICCCFEGLFTQICVDVLMASCHDFMECHQIMMFIFSKLSYPLNDKICLQES